MNAWNQLAERAVELGAFRAGVIPVSEITFDRSFRDICASNACGNYGRCWMCPPDTGDIDTLMAQARSYDWALVYQTVSPLEDSFDFEGMMEAAHRHSQLSQQIGQLCGQLPGRHPEQAMASLEAYGVNVSELASASGMKYINGQNTVTYFGAVFFQEA